MFEKILEIFTKKYRKETEYYSLLQNRISDFKLCEVEGEDINEKVMVLRENEESLAMKCKYITA